MELLDLLEQRIGALLTRIDTLAGENASLKSTQAGELAALAEENHALERKLEEERAKNAEALRRIEAIMERIKAAAETEAEQYAGDMTVQE